MLTAIESHLKGDFCNTHCRVFKRFYKGDKSRSKDGNGLGLVIVKKIVELFSGKVYFESEPSKGTTFKVELPV
jgi:signal transduction histidine kinase